LITLLFVVIACALQIKGHVEYNKDLEIEPNTTAWTIWGLTSLIDTWNYSEMTGDMYKNALPIVCALGCLTTWALCLFRGRFKKLVFENYLSFLLCGGALIVWKEFDLVKESNMILQVDNVISFLPIIYGVIRNPKAERPAPWMWWTASYALGTVVVLMRYQQWQDLLFPLGSMVLHCIVGALSLRKKLKPLCIAV
jgi:hypothetical protein